MSSESPKYNYQNRGLLAPPKLTTPASTENGCNIGLYSNHGLSHNLPQTTQVSYESYIKAQDSYKTSYVMFQMEISDFILPGP